MTRARTTRSLQARIARSTSAAVASSTEAERASWGAPSSFSVRSAAMQRQLVREPGVAPSILSSDFAQLGAQVAEVMDAGARVIHCDVMDGHFVPPITLGPLIVGSLADQVHGAGGILDVHLMIERPERHVEEFAKAGAPSPARPRAAAAPARRCSWPAPPCSGAPTRGRPTKRSPTRFAGETPLLK